MIAPTRETSTRSTPTPTALTAEVSSRRVPLALEAQAPGQPARRGEVATEDEAEPEGEQGERDPRGEQRPRRRPPGHDGIDFRRPAPSLVRDHGLERQPGDFEPPGRSA